MRAMIRERDDALALLTGHGVSVVIPCFEQQRYLAKSLGSVLAQTVSPLEVLVIDDGSAKPIKAPAHDTIPVRVIRVANRGLPSARNVGLMNARGHAFLPLDADDWIEPTYLEKTLPLLDAGADVVFTGLKEHGVRKGAYMPGCEIPLEQLTVEQERASNRLFYCALIRISVLRDAGGYNGRMIHGYEDWDLWVDLMQRGCKLDAVREPLFNYRTSKDGMLADTERNWREWCLDEMARHHGYERPQPPPPTPPQRVADRRLRAQQARELQRQKNLEARARRLGRL